MTECTLSCFQYSIGSNISTFFLLCFGLVWYHRIITSLSHIHHHPLANATLCFDWLLLVFLRPIFGIISHHSCLFKIKTTAERGIQAWGWRKSEGEKNTKLLATGLWLLCLQSELINLFWNTRILGKIYRTMILIFAYTQSRLLNHVPISTTQ